MVLPHAEPDEPTPEPEDDGEKERQRDTDTAKEISDNLLKEFKNIFKPEGASFPTTEHKGKWW